MPNRTVRVPLITRQRLDDLERARVLIEGRLVQMALPNLSKEDIDILKQVNRDCDHAFEEHGRISAPSPRSSISASLPHLPGCGSQVLIPIVESLWLQSGPVVRAAAQIHDEQGGLAATDHHWAMSRPSRRAMRRRPCRRLPIDIGRSFDLVRARLASGEEAA